MTTPDETPELAPVRPGDELDWDKLVAYLGGKLDVTPKEWSVQQFPNGSANLTYLLALSDDLKVVIRRPPLGEIAAGAHDMGREHRVLSRLNKEFPRAPLSLLFCDDKSIIGSDFDVMEYRPGVVVWRTIPKVLQVGDNVAHRVGLAVAEALGDLHLVDPEACDLGDLGRPQGFLQRQVGGWTKRWNAVASDGETGLMADAAKRLANAIPENPTVSILHNDYQLSNVQFAAGKPDSVYSVFDWDMATLGDPLLDFATLLNYWPDPSDSEGSSGLYLPEVGALGLPSHVEMTQQYAKTTGYDIGAFGWYQAFASFRVAVILQQLAARYYRGETTDPRMKQRGELVRPQVLRAIELLDLNGIH